MNDTTEVLDIVSEAPTPPSKVLVYVGFAVAGFAAAKGVTWLLNKRKENA